MWADLNSRRRASFCVTFVGCTAGELTALEADLNRARGSLRYAARAVQSATVTSFPGRQVHAIVFSIASAVRVTVEDTAVLRAATALGTCRVYVVAPDNSVAESGTGLLDDFVERSPDRTANTVAQHIIEFFREADHVNIYSTHRGLRDAACLQTYPILSFLWDFSYVIGGLHTLNTLRHVTVLELWSGVHLHPIARLIAIIFGAFFIVTSLGAIVRNVLYSVIVLKRLSVGLFATAGFFCLAAAATVYSIGSFDESALLVSASSALAVIAYCSYMYCRRVRVECTSLSELQTAMDDFSRRTAIVDRVGKAPLGANAYPLFSSRSKSVFISYGRGSEWSCATAEVVRHCTGANGFDVFLDKSSIPSGSLWRQALLRSLSECKFFIAVLDSKSASRWVLAECVYAAMLRKSIGKPSILIVTPSAEQLDALRQSPFGILFGDIFDFRHAIREGGSVLIVGEHQLSEARVMQALNRIRPMSLLV